MIGNFTLNGIPPAAKGVPKIEVTFDIDADGIINVSAKDQTSNKDASITVAGSSGLTDAEIEQMINDAEKFKESDAQRKKVIETANKAETDITKYESSIAEHREKLNADSLKEFEQLITETRELIAKSLSDEVAATDAEVLESKLKELETKSLQLFEVLFKGEEKK